MSTNMPQTPRQTTVTRPRAIGWWLAYAAVVLAIVTNTVFGLLSLLVPASFLTLVGERSAEVSADAQIFAAYAGARELAIAVALLVLLFIRARRALAGVILLAALANGFDLGHALLTQRWVQVPGALIFAIIYLAAAVWFFRHMDGPDRA